MSVTINRKRQYFNGAYSQECNVYCKSTDTKPTENIPNGATLTEIDTGNYYLFDGDTTSWVFQFSMQG